MNITTNSRHKYPIVPNKLNRKFTKEKSNEAWVLGITYIATKQGLVVLDYNFELWDRKIIG
jgi:putative transposase